MNSDCGANKNKYYIVQVLKNKNNSKYHLHTRYGRVGTTLENTMQPCSSLDQAASEYQKKYKQKTSNAKGYTPIGMKLGESSAEVKPTVVTTATSESFLPSKLDANVASLVSFIYDKKLMEKQVEKVGYDVKRLPLGQLSDDTVKKGYDALR